MHRPERGVRLLAWVVSMAATVYALVVLLGAAPGHIGAAPYPVGFGEGVVVYPVPALPSWSHAALIAVLALTGTVMLRRYARFGTGA